MSTDPTIAEQIDRANATGLHTGRVRPRPLAAAEQLGPLGSALRGGRLRGAVARLARRPRDRRGGQRAPRGLRPQDRRTDRRPLRRRDRQAEREAGGDRALLRRPARPDPRRRGLSAASVAIDPAPFRGVLPLPISALKSASPVLGNPPTATAPSRSRYEQFRFAFANAVNEDEAKELYETFAVPAPGAPLFQAATANLNPWTEAKVDSKNPDRGPLLIISGEKDNTVPWAIANASYKKQKRNAGVTEIVEIPTAGTRSRSTAAGATSPTRPSASSSASRAPTSPSGAPAKHEHAGMASDRA